jgi:hypothetical protein
MSMSYIAWPDKGVSSIRGFSFNRENAKTQAVKKRKPCLTTNSKDTFCLRSRATKN